MSNPTTLPAVPWTTVGRTGLRTTKLGIGTWGFGPIGAPETQVGDDESLVAVLRAAFDAGVRYLDTAESYANEERLGRLLPLAGAPPDLVIATKSGRSGKVTEGFTADHFRRSVENSLRQLQLQTLPLLLIHDPRDEADMAVVLGPGGALEGLRKMQAEGLVQSIGIATGTLGPLWTAVESGEFDVIQMPRLYTLLNTAAKDTGLLAAAKAKNIGTMVPAPFGGNILATGVRPDRQPLYMYRPAIPEVVEAVKRMEERCHELGISLPVAALAFVLTEPLVDLTVVGLARPEEVYWNIPACDAGVSRADLESIREAGRIDPVLIGGPDFKPVFAAAQRQV
jgi:D-threo-aldose 1-dehydrogenase